MFEEIIAVLDSAGIQYEEDYDNGTLTIDIADTDKDTLVDVINAIMGTGLDYTIDASSITVTGGEMTGGEGEAEAMPTDAGDYSAASEDALSQYLQ